MFVNGRDEHLYRTGSDWLLDRTGFTEIDEPWTELVEAYEVQI